MNRPGSKSYALQVDGREVVVRAVTVDRESVYQIEDEDGIGLVAARDLPIIRALLAALDAEAAEQ